MKHQKSIEQIKNFNTKVKTADNFTFNITDQANIEAKDLNNTTPNYLTALNNQLSSDKISATNLQIINNHIEDTNRQLTETGVAAIAITAVVATVLTAGAAAPATMSVGATVATAGATAGASAAAATASTSAASASMNAQGDGFKQAKSISKTTWDDTTSRESFENYAISYAVAATGAYLGEHISQAKSDYMKQPGSSQVSQGNSTLFDQNTVNAGYSNSKLGINSEYILDPTSNKMILVKEGTTTPVPYWSSNQNPIFKALNTLPGSPSFVDWHDASQITNNWGLNQLSIAPYYATSQFNAVAPYYSIFIDYETNTKQQ